MCSTTVEVVVAMQVRAHALSRLEATCVSILI
jgi:hypothetical protein